MTQPRLTDESRDDTDARAVGVPAGSEAAAPHSRIAGNWADDDGRVIDQMFEPNPNGPNLIDTRSPFDALGTYDDTQPKMSRIVNRALSVGQSLGTAGIASLTPQDPILLLPADANRKRLRLQAYPPGQTYFTLTNPAAGAQWSYTVPTGQTRTIRSIRASFAASAAVATRGPYLEIVSPDGTTVIARFGSAAFTASQVGGVTWSDYGMSVSFGDNLGALPYPFILPAGYIIRSQVISMDVADQWSAVTLLVSDYSYRFASEKSDIYGAADIPVIAGDSNIIDLGDHTGAVWIYAPNTCAPFTVQASAVTT